MMIKLQIIGHLGKNAAEHQVGGKSVLNFSVAHNQRFKNAQGVFQERTVWVECAMWSPNAVGPYLLQGTQVYVEGIPYAEAYMNSQHAPAAALKMRVSRLQLLGNGNRPPQEDGNLQMVEAEPSDELPF